MIAAALGIWVAGQADQAVRKPSKNAFGYALVDEVLAQMIAAQWITPLGTSDDPLETIGTEFERGIELLKAQRPILGCPLNNLAQEMNPLDTGFRDRTTRVFQTWREAYRSALARAQHRGLILPDVDPADAVLEARWYGQGADRAHRHVLDPAILAHRFVRPFPDQNPRVRNRPRLVNRRVQLREDLLSGAVVHARRNVDVGHRHVCLLSRTLITDVRWTTTIWSPAATMRT
jgi:hypothetical protein